MKSLLNLYEEHQGKVSVKWPLYLDEYDRIFSSFRGKPLRILEIGVQNGGSLEIWSKYFPNAQILVGCDINQDCKKLKYLDDRINLVIGDINTDLVYGEVLKHSKNFDLIIDDGSHLSGDIVKSFARYFSTLNEGGIFVVEDLHCSYWLDYEGGLRYPYSSMSFFKLLADIVNYEHWGNEKERRELLQGFSKNFSVEFGESDLKSIHSIEFLNSLCIVKKRHPRSNLLGDRFTAGRDELVVPGHRCISGLLETPSQVNNEWAVINDDLEKVLRKLQTNLSEKDFEVKKLGLEAIERDAQILSLNQAIDAIHQSTSWRLTAPLRNFAKLFRGL